MKVSIHWLNQFVEIRESPVELADMLTTLGLEAEVSLDLSSLKKVISGKVLSAERHPNADKLKSCKIWDGDREYNVVCGAPNVETGQNVVFARVGAILANDFKIKKVRIRGEESFGMICSERELGISDEHEGIMVLPEDTEIGQPVAEILNRTLASLELDITPNRPDALSHLGIAREIAIKTGRKLKKPVINPDQTPEKITESVTVTIDDPEGCPRYVAGIVKNVKIGPSPQWMADMLTAVGMRPINNLVDISNYVLLETGHPTHIFDFEKFPSKEVCIRRAKKGELFRTLDEEERKLNDEHLLITNGKDPVALAGIMGGLDSAVSESTTTVLIESAYFDPITIRKGSKALGMLTESSRRFERGADPNGTVNAFWRIVDLLKELTGGELASGIIDAYPNKIAPPVIVLRQSKLKRISGFGITEGFVEQTLAGLEIDWSQVSEDTWECIPPSFRPDLEREIDLIEEIIRVYGYDKAPASNSFSSLFNAENPDPQADVSLIHRSLTGMGYRQCYNNSLQSEVYATASGKPAVSVMNPLSQQMSVLRTSLLPGLLQTIDFNIKNGNQDLLLYEVGQIHYREREGFAGIKEEGVLCGVIHGLQYQESIHRKKLPQSFYSLKGHVDTLLKSILHVNPKYIACENPEFDICYEIFVKKQLLGYMGQVSMRYIKNLNLETETVYGFELSLSTLLSYVNEPIVFKPVSVYPKVDRDLNFVMNEVIHSGDIEESIIKVGRGLVREVRPINIFRHESLGDGKKSVVFTITFQSDTKTLEDKEVNPIIDEIISVVTDKFGAKLRA